MLASMGLPSRQDCDSMCPTTQRFERGPVAVAECFQEIPCDPCSDVCPVGAVRPFSRLVDHPVIDFEICTGCCMCVARCPGQAIFVVDGAFSDSEDLVVMPYEFLPQPEVGAAITALDRTGQAVTAARVVAVRRQERFDRTVLLSVAVPKGFGMVVRAARLEAGE